jgi:hypothetical protein
VDTLRIRVYNVHFGDAILISVPDHDASGVPLLRHILIDVGNITPGEGTAGDVYEPVIRDILSVLDGRPLDLYILTHEHRDHAQGLFWAARQRQLEIPVDYSWLTASCAPDYYTTHPDARERKLALDGAYEEIVHYLGAAGMPSSAVEALALNNSPTHTQDCVDYLLSRTPRTTFISRGTDLAGRHPFRDASFAVWAPEENTAVYYHAPVPMALGLAVPAGGGEKVLAALAPPSGVDAGAFFNLVDIRRGGFGDNLLMIDRAANNTSVVFAMEWGQWHLLFAGDAEEKSWQKMAEAGVLRPVDFLKVSHHGSRTGLPPADVLDQIFPSVHEGTGLRQASVSTCEGVYPGVPDLDTLATLGQRAQLRQIGKAEDPLFIELAFEG